LGSVVILVGGLHFCWRDAADLVMEASVIEPYPWGTSIRTIDQLLTDNSIQIFTAYVYIRSVNSEEVKSSSLSRKESPLNQIQARCDQPNQVEI